MLILVSGFSYLLSTGSASLIVARELALPAEELRNLISAYHAGNNLFSLALITLLWHYPRRLGGRGLLWLFAGCLAFAWLNERHQWHDLPGHNVGFQVSVVLLVGVTAVIGQWRATRTHPGDRAVVKFLIVALALINIIALVSYYHAAWFSGKPLVPLVASLGLAGLFYLALVIGVARYRLFDVDRWWLYIWLWLAAGTGILGLDILVSLMAPGLGQYSLVLVLVLVGWIYFPLRQWLWEKVFPASESDRVLEPLAGFILRLVTGRERDPDAAWQELLKSVFAPLELARLERISDTPCLLGNGERLYVPGLVAGGHELRLAGHGARLFHSGDLALARTLHGIASGLAAELEQHRQGIARERERIMRDLHDDVGGRLLTLIHECTDVKTSETAREALEALRDVIHLSVERDTPMDLSEVVARWRWQIRKRTERAGVKLMWEWEVESMSGCRLKAMEALNLSRILHEAVSNALRHARPTEIRVSGRLQGGVLRVEVFNDGLVKNVQPEGDNPQFGGWGTENMKRRAAELEGSLTVELLEQSCRVQLAVPLPNEEISPGESLLAD